MGSCFDFGSGYNANRWPVLGSSYGSGSGSNLSSGSDTSYCSGFGPDYDSNSGFGSGFDPDFGLGSDLCSGYCSGSEYYCAGSAGALCPSTGRPVDRASGCENSKIRENSEFRAELKQVCIM